MRADRELKIFTGTANRSLAKEVADYIGIPLGMGEVQRFSDGESFVNIRESVRGADVFIIQSLCNPVNDNLMELLIYIDALKRASASRINAVIPYYGYARQDRKMRAREPITAKLVADLLTTAGAQRVICMDLHAGQIQGYFNIPVDHLMGMPILARYFRQKNIKKGVVVSPDLGGVTRARELGERLGMPLAIIDKRRPRPNEAEVMNIIGDIKGKEAIMIDDLIDTGGTITQGAEKLMEMGAEKVYACCTHPVLSGPAKERITRSSICELVVTNTIPLSNNNIMEKITVLSVASLIGDAIVSIHKELSVSALFD
ncbi:MAG TPA: ribose-phosphate pyrophosphokinase [Firmicutes bacterium]|nr:ribose-phosphate pyrophosphokinase [Bacillota bacterium]